MPKSIGRNVWFAIGLFFASIAAVPAGPAQSREQDRTLKLYFGHTGERGEFTFKRNGRYDRSELARINRFLRDWRRNEPANIDPKLLDLVWAIYKQSGSRDYIHVVSAYRSLTTNNMLRSRSKGVAEKSQHTLGKAIDWYVPDVPLTKLRSIAMKMQGGGVGYYPSSGSPFIHTDTGNVRAWPRMSRSQLLALFPNGETLHLPADGKPLPGYQKALASRRSAGTTTLAYLETGDEESDGKGWLKRLFDGGADQAEDESASAAAPAPTKRLRGEPPQLAPATPPAAAPVTPPSAAPVEPPAPPADVLVADIRMPRPRPAGEADLQLASLSPEIASEAAISAEDGAAVASLAFAPPPRTRPDAALLAGSLADDSRPDALAVAAEDAIAALAIQPPAAPAQIAYAPEAVENSPISEADRAILAGFSAIEDPAAGPPVAPAGSPESAIEAIVALSEPEEGARSPRPRPLALAFTGAGLKTAAPTADAAPAAAAPPVAAAAAPQTPAAATAPAGSTYDSAKDPINQLIAMRTAEYTAAEFGMPQPSGAPELFSIPASAAAIAAPSRAALATDHFEVDASAEEANEESFFSRLFASLPR